MSCDMTLNAAFHLACKKPGVKFDRFQELPGVARPVLECQARAISDPDRQAHLLVALVTAPDRAVRALVKNAMWLINLGEREAAHGKIEQELVALRSSDPMLFAPRVSAA